MNKKNGRKRLQKITSLVLALAFLLGLAFVPIGTGESNNPDLQSVIIQGHDSALVAQLVEAFGGKVTSQLEVINGVGAIISKETRSNLLANPEIVRIVPNAEVRLSDYRISSQNDNFPETDYPDTTGADLTWEGGSIGSGLSVAVVDTGIAPHQGLIKDTDGGSQRIAGWVDFIDGKKNPTDPNGHGTHIAGIIANSQYGSDGEWNGVAPGVNLVGVRVLNQDGFGTYEQVIQGIQWVIEHKSEYNIRVMNLSLVALVQSPYWADPLNQAVMRAWAEGITVVVATGNSGPDPMTIGVPGNTPYVITVGAFTDNYTVNDWSDDYITPFSSAGPTLDGFVKPDVVAPGAHITSTMSQGSEIAKNHTANWVGNRYFSMAGTSQAAAIVSGIASLVLSHNPDLTPDQVKYRIMVTALPWMNPESSEAAYSMWQQGSGRVNAPDAVFADISESANIGMDIWADLAGEQHYEGYSYYDEETGLFRLKGDFGTWLDNYNAWDGTFGAWSGTFGAWSGTFGAWSGTFGAWSGTFGAWSGTFGAWSGTFGAWSGTFGAWSGGFGTWSNGLDSWTGSEPWTNTIYANPSFVNSYMSVDSPDISGATTSIGIWVEE
ncbi:MAG: S8 family peptidase [Anaerolineaceae bacterium]|nr:S8 family peptidase [Anaerolineaceae bacterium]